ncbi:MAG: hypothetical protein E6Q97_21775 [Desulfurellales bacterium]|nr:MAG: hypothetical protein E6Q97_21775 [Desulfurellales bacterium]
MSTIAIVNSNGKDQLRMIFVSGDDGLDKSLRLLAPIASKQPPIVELQRIVAVHAGSMARGGPTDRKVSKAICWRSSDPPPDRSDWPGKTFTCAGVLWGRTMHESGDVGHSWPRWGLFRNVPTTNQSSAESMLRSRLLAAGKAKAQSEGGTMQLTADQSNGIPSSEAMVCWDGSPPKTAPMGWPETIRPWAETIAVIGQYSEWIEELPPPTKRL